MGNTETKEYWEIVLERIKDEEREVEAAKEAIQRLNNMRSSWFKVALQHLQNLKDNQYSNTEWPRVSGLAWDFLEYMKGEGMLE